MLGFKTFDTHEILQGYETSKEVTRLIKIFYQIANDVFIKQYSSFKNTYFSRIFGWNQNLIIQFSLFLD